MSARAPLEKLREQERALREKKWDLGNYEVEVDFSKPTVVTIVSTRKRCCCYLRSVAWVVRVHNAGRTQSAWFSGEEQCKAFAGEVEGAREAYQRAVRELVRVQGAW